MLGHKHMNNVNQYLLENLPTQNEWVLKLEKEAKEHRVPIMDPVSMNYVMQLIRLAQPQSILEIGTAIGYSALRMQQAAPRSKITTIEKNEQMYERAFTNIKDMNHHNKIEIIYGDAMSELTKLTLLERTYDFIFIDAAKGKYKQFFELVQPLISNKGVIVCDNVLFRGYVAHKGKAEQKRLEKLAEKLRLFNEWLSYHQEYDTSIVPIGDGISISIKKD